MLKSLFSSVSESIDPINPNPFRFHFTSIYGEVYSSFTFFPQLSDLNNELFDAFVPWLSLRFIFNELMLSESYRYEKNASHFWNTYFLPITIKLINESFSISSSNIVEF